MVDATGQEAVSHTALAAGMEDAGDPGVGLVVEYYWHSEEVALQDSAAAMRD